MNARWGEQTDCARRAHDREAMLWMASIDAQLTEAHVVSEAKRRAQDALFTAIADQAETNMRAALRAPEKAALLHELAEAYRLTAGTASAPNIWTARNGEPAGKA